MADNPKKLACDANSFVEESHQTLVRTLLFMGMIEPGVDAIEQSLITEERLTSVNIFVDQGPPGLITTCPLLAESWDTHANLN